MKRADKVIFKKSRAFRRRSKKLREFAEIKSLASYKEISFQQARSIFRNNGRFFTCEMGYGDCEERGYCNGDC
jgi:hypothetical protein